MDEAWQDYEATYAWFLGLQLLDLMSTVAVLFLGGGESNPVAASAWAQDWVAGFLGLKLALIVVTFVVWLPALAWIVRRPDGQRRWALAAFQTGLVVSVLVYSLVVVANFRNLAILLRAPAG